MIDSAGFSTVESASYMPTVHVMLVTNLLTAV